MDALFPRWVAALTLTLAASLMAKQAGPEVGQPVPRTVVQDQHGQPLLIESDTTLILYSNSRKASSLVQAVLAGQPAGFLASRRAVYLANLSRMPAFITRTLALPALREMPFRMGVVLDEGLTENWPAQDGAVTLIEINDHLVEAISHVRSEPELRRALGLPASP